MSSSRPKRRRPHGPNGSCGQRARVKVGAGRTAWRSVHSGGATAADFNNDGLRDLASANYGSGDVTISLR
jgi:hypothetical protein